MFVAENESADAIDTPLPDPIAEVYDSLGTRAYGKRLILAEWLGTSVGFGLMSPPNTIADAALDPRELEQVYLTSLRRRFKAEVNRMTGGEMRRLLGGHPNGDTLSFPLSYLYAYHWLHQNVPAIYRAPLLAAFTNPARRFLMDLLAASANADAFIRGYVDQLRSATSSSLIQKRQLTALLAKHEGDEELVVAEMLKIWHELGLFEQTYQEAYSKLGHQERTRYTELLGTEDRERFELVDALPDPGGLERFSKLALIPAMGCPQTCRHCMFIWRPPTRKNLDPKPLLQFVNAHTDNVLFTGGDLTRHLDSFTRAILTMDRVQTFAILLNGDFAEDLETTERTIGGMSRAIRQRPNNWPSARVLLQISFDEFHQEIVPDKRGRLRERIPVAKIANIVECAPRHREVQLCLLHKQTALNFSMDLFRKGVFARLTRELGRRGHQVRILSSAPSPRLKRHPGDPEQTGRVLKDASFTLSSYPDRPILLTSSTVDAYGRAALLDPGETVQDKDLLQQVLYGEAPRGEIFDTDLMFWFNGWVTLFSAVHVCLGNFHRDGGELILARHRKDPLTAALQRFDLRLPSLYSEISDDLNARIAAATGPHHLFHVLTEDAAMRLHMTRRLLDMDAA